MAMLEALKENKSPYSTYFTLKKRLKPRPESGLDCRVRSSLNPEQDYVTESGLMGMLETLYDEPTTFNFKPDDKQ